MLIKALRGSFGDHGMIRRGQIIDVPDHQGQQLVKRGLYEGVKMEGGRDGAGPLSPNGGPSGPAKPSSSSEADHQPPEPISPLREVDAAPSPSTIPGVSRRGRTPSTPVTTRGGRPKMASRNSGD
jgi:hypothetical protein